MARISRHSVAKRSAPSPTTSGAAASSNATTPYPRTNPLDITSGPACNQSGRTDQEHQKEQKMRVEQARIRVPFQAGELRHAQHDAAKERAPERADAAEHDDLEGDQQPFHAGERREARPHRQ